jgi:hypothetical protein
MTKMRGALLFGPGALSMVPVVVYARHRRRKDEIGGVMEPMTEIYQPEMGTVDDAEFESPQQQVDTPTIVP